MKTKHRNNLRSVPKNIMFCYDQINFIHKIKVFSFVRKTTVRLKDKYQHENCFTIVLSCVQSVLYYIFFLKKTSQNRRSSQSRHHNHATEVNKQTNSHAHIVFLLSFYEQKLLVKLIININKTRKKIIKFKCYKQTL